jgi:hypothetical protein
MIGITELLAKVGDDNINIQALDSCLIRADYAHKNWTVISFGTNQPLLHSGTLDMGVIVWMPRDKVEKILREAKGGGGEG